ncbi:MAG: DEAD/DEAH box helicase [Thermoplasmatota archaeon]
MTHVELKYIQDGAVERREYQWNIFQAVRDRNALVVLPTGLGKTIIAVLALAYKLEQGSVLFLAPTKPLCEQHAASIEKLTTVDDVVVVTGEEYSPEERKDAYRSGRVIVATPQSVENDLDRGVNVGDFSLIVFDEAHRAVGRYAYVGVARRYLQRGTQILGLTASPGSDYKKLVEVADNLGIEHVEVRTERDDDVRPYLSKRDMWWVLIDMPPEVKHIARRIDALLNEFLAELKQYTKQARYLKASKLSKKVLIDIQRRMRGQLGSRGGTLYSAISLVSATIKLAHLKEMLTSQGIDAAENYLAKIELDDSKAAGRIRQKKLYRAIRSEILSTDARQPKLEKTRELLGAHFRRYPDGRVMVFAEYRDTIDLLTKDLNAMPGVEARKFVGQAGGSGDGMSQEEQKQTLDAFAAGAFNVLVSTSIGEEGIDIPATTLVLFYEPVPSAIRHIQRRGRTARDGVPGNVVILIMKGSRDEAYYWSSKNKEKKMYQQILRLKRELEDTAQALEDASPEQPMDTTESEASTAGESPSGQARLDQFT